MVVVGGGGFWISVFFVILDVFLVGDENPQLMAECKVK